jgi:hypothetical protein
MIQIWKPKHSATVIRLDSLFAHGDGLPCRRTGTMANRQKCHQSCGRVQPIDQIDPVCQNPQEPRGATAVWDFTGPAQPLILLGTKKRAHVTLWDPGSSSRPQCSHHSKNRRGWADSRLRVLTRLINRNIGAQRTKPTKKKATASRGLEESQSTTGSQLTSPDVSDSTCCLAFVLSHGSD